jgi:hypothetical protein
VYVDVGVGDASCDIFIFFKVIHALLSRIENHAQRVPE